MIDYTLGPLEKWLRGLPGRRCELSAEARPGRLRAGCYINGEHLAAGYGEGAGEAIARAMNAVMLAEWPGLKNTPKPGELIPMGRITDAPRKRAAFMALESAATLIRQGNTEDAIGYLETCAAHVRALGGE